MDRASAVLTVVVLALAGGCSDDDDDVASSSAPPTVTATTVATTLSLDTTTPTSSPPAGSATSSSAGSETTMPPPSVSSTTAAPAPATSAAPADPQVAEADGWRMVVDSPRPGGSVGGDLTVCYQLSGPSREPVVALRIALLEPGTSTEIDAWRVEATVGAGSVSVDPPAAPGRYDVHVQGEVDGSALDGLETTVGDVTVSADGPPAACG